MGVRLGGMGLDLRFRHARCYPCRKAQIAVDISLSIPIREFYIVARKAKRVFVVAQIVYDSNLHRDIHASGAYNWQADTQDGHMHLM